MLINRIPTINNGTENADGTPETSTMILNTNDANTLINPKICKIKPIIKTSHISQIAAAETAGGYLICLN